MEKLILKRLRLDLEKICRPYGIKLSYKQEYDIENFPYFYADQFTLIRRDWQFQFGYWHYSKKYKFIWDHGFAPDRQKVLYSAKNKKFAFLFLKKYIRKNFRYF